MIRKAGKEHLEIITGLALQMWSDHSPQELQEEFSAIIAGENAQFFLKYDRDMPVGFAQCQLRTDYVEGTASSPVGYLEGIFVQEAYRRRGFARELLSACEKWAADRGCSEFASDCELDNEESLVFHLRMGFAEAGRIICFSKKLRQNRCKG